MKSKGAHNFRKWLLPTLNENLLRAGNSQQYTHSHTCVCMPRSKKRLKRNHAQTLCRKMLKGNGSNSLPVGQNAGGFCKRRSTREREKEREAAIHANVQLVTCFSAFPHTKLSTWQLQRFIHSHARTRAHTHTLTQQLRSSQSSHGSQAAC